MMEPETGYNTYELPLPGECYCHLLTGTRLCETCLSELTSLTPAEVFGTEVPIAA